MAREHPRPGPGPEAQPVAGGALASEPGERGVAERFAALHAVTAALSAALTPSEVIAAIAARGAALPGACGCAVGVLSSEGTLEVACRRGRAERVGGGALAPPPWALTPLAAAARDRRAVLATGATSAGAPPCGEGPGALAALPLEAGGGVLGAVGLEFSGPEAFGEEERAFLQAFAHQAAQALDRARLYEAERAARVEAQRAVELSGQLVGIVGHDLRTPLAAIRMSTALLLRRGGLTEEQARSIARIDGSAVRMTRIIHDLLDFTRVRNEGRIPMRVQPAELVSVVRRAVAELAAAHPDREIRLAAPEEVAIAGDPDRLGQVVTNLVGNALQHSPPEARVSVEIEEDAGAVSLGVHNDGPPIRADLLGEIFEPFRRGKRGEEDGSLGLGLFIVREVVRAHGGEVSVRSTTAAGTTFTVRLPLVRADAVTWGVPAPDR